MGVRDKAEPIDLLLHHVFGFLDSFGDFHLLLPSQQRNLAHLLEIHAHRVVQNIELGFGFLFLFFFLRLFFPILVAIHLRGFNYVDLHAAQPRENEIEFIGVSNSFGQRLVQIVKCEVPLFLRQLDQFTNTALDFNRRMQMGPVNAGFDSRRWRRCAIAAAPSNERNPPGSERPDFWMFLQISSKSGRPC